MRIDVTDIPEGHKIDRINIEFSHDDVQVNTKESTNNTVPEEITKNSISVNEKVLVAGEINGKDVPENDELKKEIEELEKKELVREPKEIPNEMNNSAF